MYKNNDESFYVSKFSLTESEIKVNFENIYDYEFVDKSRLSFSLVLSNDEIKREAVKLKGLFAIKFNTDEVFLNQDEGKSDILSFRHGIKVENVKKELSQLNSSINSFVKDTITDFEFVKKLEKSSKIDTIREYLVWKVERSRNEDFRPYKNEILGLLSNKVSNLFQLLKTLGKIENLFVDEHIQAQDFWRYKIYQALIEEPKKKKS